MKTAMTVKISMPSGCTIQSEIKRLLGYVNHRLSDTSWGDEEEARAWAIKTTEESLMNIARNAFACTVSPNNAEGGINGNAP